VYIILILTLLGAVFGLLARKAAEHMILFRSEAPSKGFPIVSKKMAGSLMAFFALLFAAVAQIFQASPMKIAENIVLFSVFILIAATDSAVKKIPNELLLLLILSRLCFILLAGGHWNWRSSLVGCGMALVLFLLPSLLHINIGMGDIKYAAVLGFLYGTTCFLQIILIMSFSMGLYAIGLYARNTGTLKSAVPVGPFLSLGTVITGFFPLITLIKGLNIAI